jgi:hypothetical protein
MTIEIMVCATSSLATPGRSIEGTPMNVTAGNDRDAFLENLAAELTSAAFPVVLRHGVGARWLDLELDLWKALTETVKRLEQAESMHDDVSCVPARTSNLFG